MAITAFPVLARIIYERGIAGTAVGTLTLAAGAMDDAAAWIILAVVLGSFTGNATLAALAAGGGIAYALIVFPAARWLFTRFEAAADEQDAVPTWMLSTILALLAAGAWFTDRVGIHSVFGAFVLGAAMPGGRLSRQLPVVDRADHHRAVRAALLRLLGPEHPAGPDRHAAALADRGRHVPRRLRRQGHRLLRRRARHRCARRAKP